MLIELLASYYESYAVAEVQVDDREGISALVLKWAALTRDRQLPVPRRRYEARADIAAEFSAGYMVYVSARENSGTSRFCDAPAALTSRFAETFQNRENTEETRTAQDFARQLASDTFGFFHTARRRSQERLAGGEYLRILAFYLAQMRTKVSADDQNYYDTWRSSTGKIMADEKYLLLAESEEARGLYLAIRAEESNLYNWYMDLAKGGHSGSR